MPETPIAQTLSNSILGKAGHGELVKLEAELGGNSLYSGARATSMNTMRTAILALATTGLSVLPPTDKRGEFFNKLRETFIAARESIHNALN